MWLWISSQPTWNTCITSFQIASEISMTLSRNSFQKICNLYFTMSSSWAERIHLRSNIVSTSIGPPVCTDTAPFTHSSIFGSFNHDYFVSTACRGKLFALAIIETPWKKERKYWTPYIYIFNRTLKYCNTFYRIKILLNNVNYIYLAYYNNY